MPAVGLTKTVRNFRVLHSKLIGNPGQGASAWEPWIDEGLFVPIEVRKTLAPQWATAKVELDLVTVGDHVWNWKLRRGCCSC